MKQTKFEIEDHIARRIGMARGELRRHLEHSLHAAGCDLMAEHVILLKVTSERDGMVQHEVANCLGRGKAAVTRFVDTLEASGYVERKQDPNDRRQNLLHATSKGRKFLRSIYPIIESIETAAVEGVSQRDLATCKDVLRRVCENLAAIDGTMINAKSQ